MSDFTFTNESLFQILQKLQNYLVNHNQVTFKVLNPDVADLYAGEIFEEELYRSYRTWQDLAQILHTKMLTPKKVEGNYVEITFKTLESKHSFHTQQNETKEEKYGAESDFSHIHKNEEASFLYYYMQALENIDITSKKRVLNLGINRADEFELIEQILGKEAFGCCELIGIDHSQSAIDIAAKKFPTQKFYVHDINAIDTLEIDKVDLIISIGTLQSPGINFKPFFNHLIQNYLNKNGAIILGFPNSRWIDGELIYGAKMKNYSESDLSLLINDIHYCKKYLQQKKFKVRLAGKEYIFLSAFK